MGIKLGLDTLNDVFHANFCVIIDGAIVFFKLHEQMNSAGVPTPTIVSLIKLASVVSDYNLIHDEKSIEGYGITLHSGLKFSKVYFHDDKIGLASRIKVLFEQVLRGQKETLIFEYLLIAARGTNR